MGVIVLTPLALLLLNRDHAVSRRTRVSVAVPLLVMFGLVVTLFLCASAWERERIRREFDRQTGEVVDEVGANFDRDLEVLYSVRSLWSSSTRVEANQFGAFVRPLLARHPTLAAAAFDVVLPDATPGARAGHLGPV